MIGWRCSSYIQLVTNPTFTMPSNVSQIPFNDTNRVFTIATNGVTSMPLENEYPSKYPYPLPSEMFDFMQSFIGQDAYFLYGKVFNSFSYSDEIYRLIKNSIDLLLNNFPSIMQGFPNTMSLAFSKLNSKYQLFILLYFPTLKKIIVNGTNNSTRYDWYMYDVGENGSISGGRRYESVLSQMFRFWTGGFVVDNGSSWSRSNYYFPALGDYYEGIDLTQEHDWFDISIQMIYDASGSPSNKIYQLHDITFSYISAFMADLFSVTSVPDVTNDKPPNPYEPGGDSGEGGGNGSFDDTSDQIVDSSLPTLSSANTGFTRIYNPSLSQVQDLARYLWTDESVIQTIWNHIKQFFENPMEAIIGFNLVPVTVPNGGTKNFALMYIDTGVQMTVAANQFVDQDCGTLEIPLYYGSALDYSPYTKISCFLPFIGMVQLNTDEVMDRTLQVKYRVDICSGSCVAKIFVDGNCLYQYSGHCAINIPISAADFSSYVTASISVAKLAVGAAAAGASGLVAASTVDPTQQTNQVITRTTETTTARNPSTGRQITTGTRSVVETVERPSDVSSTQASFDGLSPSNISNTVGQIMTSKPHVEHSGSFSGNTGYLGIRRPYVVIERPNMCMPSQYQQFNGFPAMITMALSDCTGFTRIQQVQLTGMEATNPEQSEILQMLKSGVIL